jgi:hypothetical protein
MTAQSPGADVYLGRIGFLRFWQSDREVFESFRYDPRKFTDADDMVVVPIRQSGHGKASKVPVEEDIVNVWRCSAGRQWSCASTRPNKKPSKPWDCGTQDGYEVSYAEGVARNRCHA